MNTLTESIEKAIDDCMGQISQAADRKDLNVLEHLTQKASELRAMEDQVAAIENRLRSLGNGSELPDTPARSGAIRELAIDVTQGMINQNLLTLTDHIKRGMLRPGEKLNVETVPTGDCFETELLASGNKLKERGKIGKFYREVGVHAGDVVVLREITPGIWQLAKGEMVRWRRQ
jgi:hypothetical protein